MRSRWRSDLLSGMNSAREMAPSVVSPVSERKSRLSEWLTVKAILRADTWHQQTSYDLDALLTPSELGPQQGLELMSRVSRVELYLSASASSTSPAPSMRLSLRLRTFSVRLRFST